MQIQIDSNDIIVVPTKQQPSRSQAMFNHLLGTEQGIRDDSNDGLLQQSGQPVDALNNATVPVKAMTTPSWSDIALSGNLLVSLPKTVGSEQGRIVSINPVDVECSATTHLLGNEAKTLQKLQGLQHYLHSTESSDRVRIVATTSAFEQRQNKSMVINPWLLIATGDLSFESAESITVSPMLQTPSVSLSTPLKHVEIEGKVPSQVRPSAHQEQSQHWWFSSDVSSASNEEEIELDLVYSAPVHADERQYPLFMESLTIVPAEDERNRVYYRNYVSKNPELSLRQAITSLTELSGRISEWFINGRHSDLGEYYGR